MSIRHSLVLAWIWCLLLPALGSAEQPPGQDGEYGYHEPSRDGIGKRYFGREIARIMVMRKAGALLEVFHRLHPHEAVACRSPGLNPARRS
jgi:hypothetical protein